jgi:hypothetical protein
MNRASAFLALLQVLLSLKATRCLVENFLNSATTSLSSNSSSKALDAWISGIEFDKVKDCVGLRQLVKPWDED